ncbi:hypothetical protein [Actinomadura sp. CNU-125]|uniref:hypothetical protein n=1 Tax=Actinomadura sp. CNU-125 TaxID=1904961 RepID=UPI0021CC5022|nr:hypothetical protein [Actinomadura sp. CNU-125]
MPPPGRPPPRPRAPAGTRRRTRPAGRRHDRGAYRSTVRAGGDGFGRLLLAEWTKLRSVPRWVLAFAAAVVVTALVALLTAASTQTTGGGGPGTSPVPAGATDQGHYTYRTLTGDGSMVARVASQRADEAWAKAGLMVRAGASPAPPTRRSW